MANVCGNASVDVAPQAHGETSTGRIVYGRIPLGRNVYRGANCPRGEKSINRGNLPLYPSHIVSRLYEIDFTCTTMMQRMLVFSTYVPVFVAFCLLILD